MRRFLVLLISTVIEGKPANGFDSGQLPELGMLDSLATQRGQQDVWFDVVGYGLQQIKPAELAETSRLQASVQLINLQSTLTDGYNIHHTNAPGTGGGTCFGDSSGPVFLSGANGIVGITSFGLNGNCVGGGFAYRTDIANTLDWVWPFFLRESTTSKRRDSGRERGQCPRPGRLHPSLTFMACGRRPNAQSRASKTGPRHAGWRS